MFRPIEEDDLPIAAALLSEGFPERSTDFWTHGLQELRRHADPVGTGVPLGQLMLDGGGRPVGVVLTPSSLRSRGDQPPQRVVNVSSWYVRPEHRLRAASMLRKVVADPQAVYVDLTPSDEVSRMLPLFGFRPVNRGTTVAFLPWHACRPNRGGRVRGLRDDERLAEGEPSLSTLFAHRELRCETLVLEHPEGRALFVYRTRPVRGVPAARLKYIGSHAVLQRHLPCLARHLLARGLLLLSFDTREPPMSGLGLVHRPGGIWYAKGGSFDDRTDFIGTELCILGI